MDKGKTYLTSWNKQRDDRTKLQHVYAVVAAISLVIAGLAGLVNDELGYYFLQITFIAAAVLFLNAITWALLESFILNKLPRSNTASRNRK